MHPKQRAAWSKQLLLATAAVSGGQGARWGWPAGHPALKEKSGQQGFQPAGEEGRDNTEAHGEVSSLVPGWCITEGDRTALHEAAHAAGAAVGWLAEGVCTQLVVENWSACVPCCQARPVLPGLASTEAHCPCMVAQEVLLLLMKWQSMPGSPLNAPALQETHLGICELLDMSSVVDTDSTGLCRR